MSDSTTYVPCDPAAVVTYRGRRWPLTPEAVLTIGRSPSCDVRLPEDDYLSRHAGSLRLLDDCVLVRNDSGTKPLAVRPPAGEDRVIEPGGATTSLPHRRFSVVFTGGFGAVVAVDVEVRPTPAEHLPPGAITSTATATVTAPIQLSPAQTRALTALCAPLLLGHGAAARPASYQEIGDRLGRRPLYVRNVLKMVRETLSGHGVPGLVGAEDGAGQEDFRWELARWAVRNGWVTSHDVERLGGERLASEHPSVEHLNGEHRPVDDRR